MKHPKPYIVQSRWSGVHIFTGKKTTPSAWYPSRRYAKLSQAENAVRQLNRSNTFYKREFRLHPNNPE